MDVVCFVRSGWKSARRISFDWQMLSYVSEILARDLYIVDVVVNTGQRSSRKDRNSFYAWLIMCKCNWAWEMPISNLIDLFLRRNYKVIEVSPFFLFAAVLSADPLSGKPLILVLQESLWSNPVARQHRCDSYKKNVQCLQRISTNLNTQQQLTN